jgi:hypothetical protein
MQWDDVVFAESSKVLVLATGGIYKKHLATSANFCECDHLGLSVIWVIHTSKKCPAGMGKD